LSRYSPAIAGTTNKTNHFMTLFLFQGGVGGLGGALVPMLLIFGVFYLLLIRPQQKKQRQLQATIAELKAGDKVITTGGVIGTITAVRDTSFFIRSADKTILEIARSAVAGVDSDEEKK
jgi:preprotein translocase subunit YajC